MVHKERARGLSYKLIRANKELDMQCKCGDTAVDYEHEVKTLKKAVEWFPNIDKEELPILITVTRCISCGRQSKPTRRSGH